MTSTPRGLPALHPPDDRRRHVVVLAGGDPPRGPLAQPLGRVDEVIAADGGAALAEPLGLRVDVLVGDLDSIDPSTRARVTADGARIESHPRDKEHTDLALALDVAVAAAAARCTVVGGAGGRLDHLAGNLSLLCAPGYASLELTALMGPAIVHVVRNTRMLATNPGEHLSLLALHGDARGVELRGVRWPLAGDALSAGSSRGISNEALADRVWVGVQDGVVLLVRPDPRVTVD